MCVCVCVFPMTVEVAQNGVFVRSECTYIWVVHGVATAWKALTEVARSWSGTIVCRAYDGFP